MSFLCNISHLWVISYNIKILIGQNFNICAIMSEYTKHK